MNILAPYSWIKDYLKNPAAPEEFAKRMSASGMSVEYRHELTERFAHIVVGRIKDVRAHPTADRLRLVDVDVGEKTVQVVCGGTNVAPGLSVAVALPGAHVRWHGEGELVTIEETEIRGEKSHGMICAADEIGFEKLSQPDGAIWDISVLTSAEPGTLAAEALDLDDTLFDIEVTTNRPDAMSMVGLAREAGAVEAGQFVWKPDPQIPEAEEISLSVHVREPALCPRYQGIVLDGVKIEPSPWWLQKRLLLAGHRPINVVVDVTNYVLHAYGQPMHAFDYDKLSGGEIVVRRAQKGEHLMALNGNAYELKPDNLVIADATHPVAVAGVMGGQETGVSEATTRVVLECATFEPVQVRRTARALNLFSDSQLLFEKGLSTEAPPFALSCAVEMLQELAGARVASRLVDIREEAYHPLTFPYSADEVNDRLGYEIPPHEQRRILESLGFEFVNEEGSPMLRVPFWRDHDIEESVDFTEEVARVFGYANLPATLPRAPVQPDVWSPVLYWNEQAKEIMGQAGATELYHYSFASEEDLRDFGHMPSDALAFVNPLSEDQKYLRVSLIPSVLRTIERNQGATSSERVFELAAVYIPRMGDLPREETRLVYAGYGREANDFLSAKGVLERLLGAMGIVGWTFERLTDDPHWHPGRSACIKKGGVTLGVLGEMAPDVQKRFGIHERVTLFELDMPQLVPLANKTKMFSALPQFPSVKRDVAFVIERTVEHRAIQEALAGAHPLLRESEMFDAYEGEGIEKGKKSMAWHVEFRADDRTLTSEEVERALSTVTQMLEKQFRVTMRT
ncbi:phenylalanine--tRNA ligase subunit beta [Candidatus Uhrbacteria bacterium]|nr:phenylalanine--tRNA ligase subunit beta [Candidatus Uhrbacteria bacterium]